jgi:thiamine-phosphate pyrophosphorylase
VSAINKIYRIIDANANRLREALRVCEDITRFVIQDKKMTRQFKSLRHGISLAVNKFDTDTIALLKSRNSEKDIGKRTIKSETKRKNISDIFKANMKRAEESLRVLEEFSKLLKPNLLNKLKAMRFKLYSLEKSIVERL